MLNSDYETSTVESADVKACQLLSNPNIQEELLIQQKKQLEEIRKQNILDLIDKKKLLSKIAIDSIQDERANSIKAVAELNKMDGDYAPVKTKNVNQQFTFVQEIDNQETEEPTEKPVLGETLED